MTSRTVRVGVKKERNTPRVNDVSVLKRGKVNPNVVALGAFVFPGLAQAYFLGDIGSAVMFAILASLGFKIGGLIGYFFIAFLSAVFADDAARKRNSNIDNQSPSRGNETDIPLPEGTEYVEVSLSVSELKAKSVEFFKSKGYILHWEESNYFEFSKRNFSWFIFIPLLIFGVLPGFLYSTFAPSDRVKIYYGKQGGKLWVSPSNWELCNDLIDDL